MNRQDGIPYNEEREFRHGSVPINLTRRLEKTTSDEPSRDMTTMERFEHEPRSENDMAEINDRCRFGIAPRARKELREIQNDHPEYCQEVIERIQENEIRGDITTRGHISR